MDFAGHILKHITKWVCTNVMIMTSKCKHKLYDRQHMYVFSNSQRTMSMDAYWRSVRLWQYKPNRLRMWLNRFENRCKDDESTKFYNWHFIGSDSTLTKMQKMIDCCQSSWSYQKFNTFFVHSWYVSYNVEASLSLFCKMYPGLYPSEKFG